MWFLVQYIWLDGGPFVVIKCLCLLFVDHEDKCKNIRRNILDWWLQK
jgi:hypothetical protein